MKPKNPKEKILSTEGQRLRKIRKRISKQRKAKQFYQGARESCLIRKCLWRKWFPSIPILLRKSSKRFLAQLTIPHESKFVDIGKVVTGSDKSNKIFTLIFNGDVNDKTPVVLIHGFGGLAFDWIDLAKYITSNDKRPVYLFDTIGFNQSSRPDFFKYVSKGGTNNAIPPVFAKIASWQQQQQQQQHQGRQQHFLLDPFGSRRDLVNKALKAEMEFIKSIEAWRSVLKLEKFILVGHSFGAYLAASYAMNYPERISHAVLVDPWGFVRHSLLAKFLRNVIKLPVNPFFFKRLKGPKCIKKFKNPLDEHHYYRNMPNPTGEEAFAIIIYGVQRARNSMGERMPLIPRDVPVTFIYGENSWVDSSPAFEFWNERENVKIIVIKNAGHVVFADNPDDFNFQINEIAISVDRERSEKTIVRGG